MQQSKLFVQRANALHEGSITFNQFVRETRASWRSLAQYILRRWRAGSSVCIEDVEQELLAAAWEYAGKYRTDDEGPRAPFAQYLVWNSVYKAKRFVHRARGVSLNGKVTHPDAAKGVRVDSMDDEKYAHKSICGTIDAYQERQVERARVRAKLAELPLTVAQVLTMGALIAADLNVEGGAVLLYNDPEARLACRLGAEGEALRLARATIREVAKKNDKRSKKVSASV